ncbi:hypothetical protein FRB94_006899 [Tulasnella sp. JGI-2019a]|nr:hypothetical protein FRB94_006899 [Tulasnella sp. JGI-2019a]KAG9005387.1 hypothetical protein FRB93_009691 [Tulasnella sp. JGI-2019a]KAG9029979.1 hypothetical protein FRB95_004682 [Tulasnella sp. JGI-2019a]
MLAHLVALASVATVAFAAQATTTNYNDGTLGACGCGTTFNSLSGVYTAAGSPSIFGSGTWCGSGCGKCYTLSSTGVSPPGQGTGSKTPSSILVVVTNLCPNAGNANWCPVAGSVNAYGYSAHFDINSGSGNGGFGSLGWNNPIVTYNAVACPTSVSSLYTKAKCQCAA